MQSSSQADELGLLLGTRVRTLFRQKRDTIQPREERRFHTLASKLSAGVSTHQAMGGLTLSLAWNMSL